MLPPFARMTDRLLAHMGEESILRSEVVMPLRKIHVKHGVQFTGYGHGTVASNGDMVVNKSVATIPLAYLPMVGDKLEHPSGTYELDVLISSNGYSAQFILRELR